MICPKITESDDRLSYAHRIHMQTLTILDDIMSHTEYNQTPPIEMKTMPTSTETTATTAMMM